MEGRWNFGKEDLDGHGVAKSLGDFGLVITCGGDGKIFVIVDLRKAIVDGTEQPCRNRIWLRYFALRRDSTGGAWKVLHAAPILTVLNTTAAMLFYALFSFPNVPRIVVYKQQTSVIPLSSSVSWVELLGVMLVCI